jgi:bifunctional polynucleotide phosphatase/kinase
MTLQWIVTKEYLYGKTNNFEFTQKFAMFDLDSTLVKPKIGTKGNGNGFPINEDDWQYNYDVTKHILKKLSKIGYCLIIISNQAGISQGKQSSKEWKTKLNNICKDLKLEMYVFCSIRNNKYRKPLPTWLYELVDLEKINEMDRSLSFYCGDACGRKGDYSNTDYKFALNCMVKFKTPESLFLGEHIELPEIDYPKIRSNNVNFNFIPQKKEMVIMVGYPGSGKSYIAKKLKIDFDYEVINQDTLKTKAKCVSTAKKAMVEGKSLVIDRTNSSINDRAEWVDLAKKNNYTSRIIYMTTSKDISMHNNHYRNLVYNTNVVPKIVYNKFGSSFETPNIKEGVKEVMELGFGTPNNCKYFLYMY